MKSDIPEWGKEVKKALIDKNMSTAELAEAINLSRSYVSNVINGNFNFPDVKQRISDYLGVPSK